MYTHVFALMPRILAADPGLHTTRLEVAILPAIPLA